MSNKASLFALRTRSMITSIPFFWSYITSRNSGSSPPSTSFIFRSAGIDLFHNVSKIYRCSSTSCSTLLYITCVTGTDSLIVTEETYSFSLTENPPLIPSRCLSSGIIFRSLLQRPTLSFVISVIHLILVPLFFKNISALL